MAMVSFLSCISFVLFLCFTSHQNGGFYVSSSRNPSLSEALNPEAQASSEIRDIAEYREPYHPSRYDEPLRYEEEEEESSRARKRYDERRPSEVEEDRRQRERHDERRGHEEEEEEEEESPRRRSERYDEEEGHRESERHRSQEEEEKEEEEEEEGHRKSKKHDERRRGEGDKKKKKRHEPERFVIEKFMKAIRTEAGEMYVLPRDANSELSRRRISLGFLILEPKALLLPQYSSTNCLFVVYKGNGRLSWIDGEDLQEIDLEEGDVFKIESGTVFHFFNKDEGQRLHVFSIHDIPSAGVTKEMSHNFFVAGGRNPETVFSGFPDDVLATVFNVSADEVHDTLSSQTKGPILYFVGKNESIKEESNTASFVNLLINLYAEGKEPKVDSSGHRLTKFVSSYFSLPGIFSKDSENKPYNILKKKPDFSNAYGSASKADGTDFEMLKNVNKGVFSVKLKAGAVLAPHWNPRAMEIALVTKGEGDIQIVYPNGSAAATERVQEGTVFYVPQNFPMCQIASRGGPLEFLGFTTSSKPNNPQFLGGLNSVLKKLKPEVLASSFNIPSEHIKRFIESQTEAVILPGHAVEPESESEPKKEILQGRRSVF